MKIKIDKNGSLHLERAGKMRKVNCPFSLIQYNKLYNSCGDWCALFDITQTTTTVSQGGTTKIHTIKNAKIELCKKTYHTDYLIDKREHGTNTTKD